jgi:hypothetical protein
MVSGASKVLCSSSAISHQSHAAAAVEVKVLAADVPSLHAARPDVAPVQPSSEEEDQLMGGASASRANWRADAIKGQGRPLVPGQAGAAVGA